MKWIKAAYFWIFAVIFTIILIIFVVYPTYLFVKLTNRRNGSDLIHRIACFWGQGIFHATPGWKWSIHGKEHIPNHDNGYVVVANHESMTDIWAIYLLGIQFRWIAKAEVFKIPLLGNVMDMAGYVPVKRGSQESHKLAMKSLENTVANGTPVFFFPEGSRSKDGVLKPFKMGAFKIAHKTGRPILPVVISGAKDMLPKGSGIPLPAHIRIEILPSVQPPNQEISDLTEYADSVRDMIGETKLSLESSTRA